MIDWTDEMNGLGDDETLSDIRNPQVVDDDSQRIGCCRIVGCADGAVRASSQDIHDRSPPIRQTAPGLTWSSLAYLREYAHPGLRTTNDNRSRQLVEAAMSSNIS